MSKKKDTKGPDRNHSQKKTGSDEPSFPRRRFLELGAAAFVGALAGAGADRLLRTEKLPPSVVTNANPLTVDALVESYKNLEKLITSEIKKAHDEHKTIKIMVGDAHTDPISFLNFLMVYDIARKNKITGLGVEFGPSEINEMEMVQRASSKKLKALNYKKVTNLQNASYYVRYTDENAPIRPLENNELRRPSEGATLREGQFTIEDVEHPEVWLKHRPAQLQELYDIYAEREKYMAANLDEHPQDEVVVCGRMHFKGLADRVTNPNVRYLYLAHNCYTPEQHAEIYANDVLDSMDPRILEQTKRARDGSESFAMLDNFWQILCEAEKAKWEMPYNKDGLAFLASEKVHKTLDMAFPESTKSLRSVENLFDALKARLEGKDITQGGVGR